jgi:hypothetical protein
MEISLTRLKKRKMQMSNKRKLNLKMLENLLHHGKNAQIRDAINKFRTKQKDH